ncbi:MAG: hypothetical protein ABI551_27070 [Polyangiaceae bacterium]
MKRITLAVSALVPVVFFAGLVVACTHDFGSFEEGTAATSSEAGPDAGPDASCTPAVACTNNATKCGTDCASNQKSCEDDCGGGRCRASCQDAGATCAAQCVGYCLTCAGCNARQACESAVQ